MLKLPLPERLRDLIGGDAARPIPSDNLGLWLDKFVRRQNNDWTLKGDARVQELERLFCSHELSKPRPWRADAASEALARLEQSCALVYGDGHYRSMELCVHGRLLVDYGRTSATEISVSMHPVLGCPRIPGSALKGVLRSYLREDWGSDSPRLRALLGPEPSRSAAEHDSHRGGLVIHDALPVGDFQLAVDVLTPHARDYYEGKGVPPADWVEPIPHTFLTVVETRFQVLMGVPPSAQREVDGTMFDEACRSLEAVLRIEGVGAKRSAGYGRLKRKS